MKSFNLSARTPQAEKNLGEALRRASNPQANPEPRNPIRRWFWRRAQARRVARQIYVEDGILNDE